MDFISKALKSFVAIILYLTGLIFGGYKVIMSEVDSKDDRVMETMRREQTEVLKSIETMYRENRKDIREINTYLRKKER